MSIFKINLNEVATTQLAYSLGSFGIPNARSAIILR
jgi:hypothetical protein